MLSDPSDPDNHLGNGAVGRPFQPAILCDAKRSFLGGCLWHAGAEGIEPGFDDDQMVPRRTQGIINRALVHRMDERKDKFLPLRHVGAQHHLPGVDIHYLQD